MRGLLCLVSAWPDSRGNIRVILGLCRDNGKLDGTYLLFRYYLGRAVISVPRLRA